MTNEELILQLKAGVEVQNNMAALYEQNRKFIYKLAQPYAHSCDLEDLLQEAFFGLVEAAERFDAEKGYKFLTYAEHWMKQKLQRYYQQTGSVKRIPSHIHELIVKYNKFREGFLAKYEVEPTKYEYIHHLQITLDQLMKLEKAMHESKYESLETPVNGADDITIGESLTSDTDVEADVVESIFAEQREQAVWGVVDQLDEKMRKIIYYRYKKNMTRAEISKIIKVSGERIRQTEVKALRILKQNKQIWEISQHYGYFGIDNSAAYRYGRNRSINSGMSATEFIALRRLDIEKRFGTVD